MKKIRENNAPQAIRLREKAIAFYLGTQKTAGGADDEEMRNRRNRDLLEAALAYARVADPVLKELDGSVKELEKFIEVLMDHTAPEIDLIRSYKQVKDLIRKLKLRSM